MLTRSRFLLTVVVVAMAGGLVSGQTAPTTHWFRGSGAQVAVTALGAPTQVVASFALPAGSWVITGFANVRLNDVMVNRMVYPASVTCSFAQGADGFTVANPTVSGTFGWSSNAMTRVSFGAALTLAAPTTLTLACNKTNAQSEVFLNSIQLIAAPTGFIERR